MCSSIIQKLREIGMLGTKHLACAPAPFLPYLIGLKQVASPFSLSIFFPHSSSVCINFSFTLLLLLFYDTA